MHYDYPAFCLKPANQPESKKLSSKSSIFSKRQKRYLKAGLYNSRILLCSFYCTALRKTKSKTNKTKTKQTSAE